MRSMGGCARSASPAAESQSRATARAEPLSCPLSSGLHERRIWFLARHLLSGRHHGSAAVTAPWQLAVSLVPWMHDLSK